MSNPSEYTSKYHVEIRDSYGIVIGDGNIINQFFLNEYYRPLAEHYFISFENFVVEKTKDFAGREWILEAVGKFISRHSCGYFRIVADAGLGKTAIAAQLVKHYEAVAHFFNASQGITRVDQCLNNLSSQLVAKYELRYSYLQESAGQDSHFFTTLLEEVTQEGANIPVVIVIDAIDEGDPTPPGHNWLHLPIRLPEGVFLVLTQRPGNLLLKTQANTPVSEPFHITWDDPHQQADIAAYLREQAKRPEITRILHHTSPTISIDYFVNELQKASEGNFMYLDFLLAEICEGEFRYDLSQLLNQLPHGLEKYYEQFWEQIEKEPGDEGYDAWRQIYLPAISVLGAAREPVMVEQVSKWSDVEIEEVYVALSNWRRGWRRFIRNQKQSGRETWWVVHSSFADFLEKKLAQTGELGKMHSKIANWYLTAWGGLEAGLPGLLTNDTEQDMVQFHNYGVTHLIYHLSKSARVDELHALLRLEHAKANGQTINLWYEAHKRFGQPGSYLADIDQAWQAAENEGLAGISKLVRYALMRTSINSLSADLPVEWLIALVNQGIRTPAQALAHVRNIDDPGQQARCLAVLAVSLPQLGGVEEGQVAARRAWDLIPKLQNQDDWAITLYTLIPMLPNNLITQALDLVRKFEQPQVRAELLIMLVTRLKETEHTNLIQEILDTIRQVESIGYSMTTTPQRQILNWSPQPLSTVMTQVSLHLPRENEIEAISKALREARNASSIYDRIEALLNLLPRLPRRRIPEVLSEALSLAREGKSDLLNTLALLAAFGWLALSKEEGSINVNDVCRQTIHAISNRKIRFLLSLIQITLVKLAPFTSRLLEALEGVEKEIRRSHQGKLISARLNLSLRGFTYYHQYRRPVITKVAHRIQLMLQLLVSLPTSREQLTVLLHAVEAAQEIEDAAIRVMILVRLTQYFPEHHEYQNKIFEQVFTTVQQVSDAYERAQILAVLSPIAQKIGRNDLVIMALSTATSLEDPYIKAKTLNNLLPYLNETDRAFALETAQRAVHEIGPGEDYYQAELLIELAGSMNNQTEQKALVEEVLKLIDQLKDFVDKAELLSRLAHISSSEKATEFSRGAWKNILNIESPSLRAQALLGLSRQLSEKDSKDFIVKQWQQILALNTQGLLQKYSIGLSTIKPLLSSTNDDLWLRAKVLSHLPSDELRQIAEDLRIIGSKYKQILYADIVGTGWAEFSGTKTADLSPNLFIKLLPDLSGTKKNVILAKIEKRIIQQDLNEQAVTKILLLPSASQKNVAEAKEFVSNMPIGIARSDALGILTEKYLVGHEREFVLREILSAIAQFSMDDTSRAEILLGLIPILPPKLLDQTMAIVNSFQDDVAFTEIMSELIPKLPEGRRAGLASETLTKVLKIQEYHIRADLLIRLAPFHSKQEQPIVLQEALKAIVLIRNDDQFQIREPFVSSFSFQVLYFDPKVDFTVYHCRKVNPVSHPKFPNQVKGFTFARLRASLRYSLLTGLKSYFRFVLFERETGIVNHTEKKALLKREWGSPSAFLQQTLPDLPSVVTMIENWGELIRIWNSPIGRVRVKHYSRSELLSRLCPLLPPETLTTAIEMIEGIKDSKERAIALVTLASHCAKEEAELMFDRAIELANIIEEPPYSREGEVVRRVNCLTYLANRMSGDRHTALQLKALEIAQQIEDQNIRMITLVKIAFDLSPELRDKAWDSVRTNVDLGAANLRAASLVALKPLWLQLPQDINYQLLSKVLQILAHHPRPQMLQGFDALIPIIGQQRESVIVDEIADAILDVMKWWP